jgi:hypothetical protein
MEKMVEEQQHLLFEKPKTPLALLFFLFMLLFLCFLLRNVTIPYFISLQKNTLFAAVKIRI